MKRQVWLIITMLLGSPVASEAQWFGPIQGLPKYTKWICFLDSLKGFAVGISSPPLARTTDGGGTWQPVALPTSPTLMRIRFADSNLGIAVGNLGAILRTTDGGTSWETRSSGTSQPFYDVTFAPDGRIWICGIFVIFVSKDSGATWIGRTFSSDSTHAWLFRISFRTAQDGWAFSDEGFPALRTTNGGTSWNEYTAPAFPSQDLLGMHWFSPSRGVIRSEGGILFSADSGNTWQSRLSSPLLGDFSFADTLNGWAVGSMGTVFRTSDGGYNWEPQSFPILTANLSAVTASGSQYAWIAGSNGIYKTTNGGGASAPAYPGLFGLTIGNAWFYDATSTFAGEEGLYTVRKQIIDTTKNGFRVIKVERYYPDRRTTGTEYWHDDGYGKLYLATDSLLERPDPPRPDPPRYDARFQSDMTFGDNFWGWSYHLLSMSIFGSSCNAQQVRYGVQYHGGSCSGSSIAAPGYAFIENRPYCCDQIESLHLRGMLKDGVVLGDTALVENAVNQMEEIPHDFSLEQNYPNPFNPKTGVRFQVSGVSDVKISVYDVLGREVMVLVNERKQPGRYEVSFDGSGLASGIYVCRLTAGSFVQSRKMLLIR